MASQKGAPTQTTPDEKFKQQIMQTHSPSATTIPDVEVNVLLSKTLDIVRIVLPTVHLDSKTDAEVLEGKQRQYPRISDDLALDIHKIGCELACDCSGEGDVTTLKLFNILKKYSWKDKLVIALSAFVVRYGEFFLVSHPPADNQLPKCLVELKPLPDINVREVPISNLVKVVIDVAKCINKLHGFPSKYKPPYAEAGTPDAVYSAIKSIVTCSFESFGLMNVDPKYWTPNPEARKKLTDLTDILRKTHDDLEKLWTKCIEQKEKMKDDEGYRTVKTLVENTTNTDNISIFRILMTTDDPAPLFDSIENTKKEISVLKGKTTALLISYVDISMDVIKETVHQVTKAARKFEIVWFPVIGKSDFPNKMYEIERKAILMPWYSLHCALERYVIKYIENDWDLENTPLLVVFDGQGNVVTSKAYHMIMTWGSAAYPFNTEREETLWKESNWSLEFLLDGVLRKDKEQWAKEGKITYLYGGDDLTWIRTLISKMTEVVKGDGIILEPIYVGRKHKDTIKKENLSKGLDGPETTQFLARLDNLAYSKFQLDKTVENDTILKDVIMLMGADCDGHGWTVIGNGSKDMAVLNGKTIMLCLEKFKEKKADITIQNLITKLKEVIGTTTDSSAIPINLMHDHCKCIRFATTTGKRMKHMKCLECGRAMQKYVIFKCCND